MDTVLHVCVTCRRGRTLAEGEVAPGRTLHAAVVAAAASRGAGGAPEIREVACLAVCGRGCGAALTAPGKWGVLIGHLEETLASDLLDYAALYGASATGTVMPSKRAPSLRDSMLGRLPG